MSNPTGNAADRSFTLTVPELPANTSLYLCAQPLTSAVYSLPQTIHLLLAESPRSTPIALFFYPTAHLTLTFSPTLLTLQKATPPSTKPTPLSLKHRTTWNSLTSFVTPQTLQSSAVPLDRHFPAASDTLPVFFPLPPLPGSLSNPLKYLIHSRYSNDPTHLLADLQLSFVSHLHLRSPHALDHWHALLQQICCSPSLSFSPSVTTSNLASLLQAQFSTYQGSRLASQPAIRKLLTTFVSREYQNPSVCAFATKLDNLLTPHDANPTAHPADFRQHVY